MAHADLYVRDMVILLHRNQGRYILLVLDMGCPSNALLQLSTNILSCVNIWLPLARQTGPFPASVLLHSYMGSAEMVSGLANLGCYFSLSGFLIGMKSTKAKQMLKSVSWLIVY